MSYQLLLVLGAAAAFAGIALLRVYGVRTHRDLPDGVLRIASVVVLLLAPPIILHLLFAQALGGGTMNLANSVLLYVISFAVIWLVMLLGAPLVARFAPKKRRPMLLLAMTGRDTSSLVPFDPPMPPQLAESVKQVDRLNATFPRGREFIEQPSLPGFRSAWDALDAATRKLETEIGEQRRLGLGVSEHALDTASDARARLDALRQAATSSGVAWAS
jgi:hypothetical protein